MPLWRGDHVPVRRLVADFASYLYLPRLLDPAVLLHAVADGVGLLTWTDDTFGYADSVDEKAGRYRGLRGGQPISVPDVDAAGVLVKPDVARRQLDAERPTAVAPPAAGGDGTGDSGTVPEPRPAPLPGARRAADAVPRERVTRCDPRRARREPDRRRGDHPSRPASWERT